jgi:TatD DNase family protein
MTEIIDIHTHSVPAVPTQAIVNVIVGVGQLPPAASFLSVGIHPWHAGVAPADALLGELSELLGDGRVVALGEAGLDRLCETPYELQLRLFEAQAEMAESRGLPLIVHVVKCHSELLRLHASMRPSVPWIIHGFRGKPELAQQYLSRGFSLSFGERFNPLSLAAAYTSRAILVESDESRQSIGNICLSAARTLGVGVEELKLCVRQNVERLFFGKYLKE